MFKCLLISLIALVLPVQQVFASDENRILGIWVNAEGDGIIEIIRERSEFVGIIIGSTDPAKNDRKDINNPDPELRNKPLKGMKIIDSISYKRNNLWAGGTIYDPNNGKTYNCKLSLEEDGSLKVRGYAGISLFGRTEIWKRHDNRDI